ncbi:hypothetical protein CHARACLAT_025043 [Characodon lateralis]|uniref:Uncharacterized protein n=1 Tax=Characodon lateralis TaxID=208331 RepID=A0ABU7DVP9_9TELE|nr:hypothetical protein [Characodon lateralis]
MWTLKIGSFFNELTFIYSPKTDGQAFSSGDIALVVGVPEADSSPGTAGLRTGSWIDRSTAEIDYHPDAAPGVSGGNLRTVPVPEESHEPRDVDVGGVFRLSTGKTP